LNSLRMTGTTSNKTSSINLEEIANLSLHYLDTCN
jgi:hypothetical protein